MSIAFVNSIKAYNDASAVNIATAAMSVTAGNLLVVCVCGVANTVSVSSITDTAGNSFSSANCRMAAASDIGFSEIWYAKNVTGHGSDVVTAALSSGATSRKIYVLQYSGVDTTTPLTATATGFSLTNVTNLVSGVFTPSAGSVAIALVTTNATSISLTANSPSTLREHLYAGDGPASQDGATEDIVGTSSTSQTMSFTSNFGVAYQISVASFKVIGGSPPTGAQFYVSGSTGNDSNNGLSPSTAWRTVQHAMNFAIASSTVNIMNGTYTELLTVGVSGTDGNPITFQPYGWTTPGTGDTVVFDYSSLGTNNVGPYLDVISKSYITVQGLTFKNFQTMPAGISGGGVKWGVRIRSSSFINMLYNTHLNITDPGTWDGTNSLANYRIDSASHDILVRGNEIGSITSNYGEALTVADGSYNVTLELNNIHDVDGIAIDIAAYSLSSHDVIVSNNEVSYAGLKHDGTTWYNNPSQAIYVDGGTFVTIERNRVHHCNHAIGTESEPGQPAVHDVTIRNNVCYSNSHSGIKVGTWYSDVDGSKTYNINVYNNTMYDSASGFLIRPYTSASVVWKNNIIMLGTGYDNSLGWPAGTMGYNDWYSVSITGPGSNNLTTNPAFTNPISDFTISQSSSCKDAGDPVTTTVLAGVFDAAGKARFQNNIDIGAYEIQLNVDTGLKTPGWGFGGPVGWTS